MDKRKQNATDKNKNGNSGMDSMNKTPNRNNSQDEMRQAKMDEEKELRDEASMPEDPDPVLDEQDLEDNQLSDEEADNIEWDPQSAKNRKSGL
ncbi:MAG TPA: hypothetical protein VG605_16115 [Puia sp.]|nr:hypothetical protein [Puia sp.]